MDVDTRCCIESKPNNEIDTLGGYVKLMRERESDYCIIDYLHKPSLMTCEEPVDVDCRSQMIQWIVNIVDHCKFNRSTASIAINYLDRFLMASEWALEDRSAFQLASITCLYTAIKVHEPTVLSVDTIVQLGGDAYRAEQIEAMERLIVDSTKWRMNPSTSFGFGHFLCEIVALVDSQHDLDTLKELTMWQLENIQTDYELGLLPASTVAFAAVMNAVESMGLASPKDQQKIEAGLQEYLHMDSAVPLQDVRVRLYEDILTAENSSTISEAKNHLTCGARTRSVDSPRSVSNLKVLS